MTQVDFREEYARLSKLKEEDPELVAAAMAILNKWGTQGPLLLYVAEGLRAAYLAGSKRVPIGQAPGPRPRARPQVSVKVTSAAPQVRTRPKR